MTASYSRGVTALDEALLEMPVFKSEAGLSHRRTKLEWVASKAFRAWVEGAISEGLVERDAVRALLGEIPEFDKDKMMVVR